MISITKFKLGQWQKLFKIFKSSLMQSLNIFGTWEGIYFAFQCFEEFKIYLGKDLNHAGPTRQSPFRPRARRHSNCCRRYLATPIISPPPLSLRVCTPVEMSSTPFLPSPHAHRSPLLSLLLPPCLPWPATPSLPHRCPSRSERFTVFPTSCSARW
jgi:hypothetical protein